MRNTRFLTALFLCLAISVTSHAQNNGAALAAADTTNFSKNTEGGWNLYNSYMSPVGGDSVRLELILQQSNTISWQDEQYVGKIKEATFRPAEERVIPFLLGGNNYDLRIQHNGKCYLKLASGPVPDSYPVVIPIAVNYKK